MFTHFYSYYLSHFSHGFSTNVLRYNSYKRYQIQLVKVHHLRRHTFNGLVIVAWALNKTIYLENDPNWVRAINYNFFNSS